MKSASLSGIALRSHKTLIAAACGCLLHCSWAAGPADVLPRANRLGYDWQGAVVPLGSGNPASVPWLAPSTPPQPATVQRVYVVDSPNRTDTALAQIRSAVKARPDVKLESRPTWRGNWAEQVKELASERPSVVVVHRHTLRPSDAGKPGTRAFAQASLQAEHALLRGLADLQKASSRTRFVIYSATFSAGARADRAAEFTRAARGALSEDEQRALLDRTLLLPWPRNGGNAETLQLYLQVVKDR